MNVKEYIRSGVIESYVLGIATEAERQEFEQMCAAYPEIAEARDAFERSLEAELMQDAVPPPAFIKEKLMLQIQSSLAEGSSMNETTRAPVHRMNLWKWVAAASLLLMAGAGYWAYTSNEKYKDLLARQSSMQEQLQQTTTQLQTLQQDAEMLRKPGMKVVSLQGTDVARQAQATIFWDTTGTKDVYMLINNLPETPTDKQYQLWAIMDNKPIDLGVFDFEVKQQRLLVKMKNVQNAQAFAITLEERGGSPTPKGNMYVLGKL